jgi:16S rRNA pseudouridine516 synthase
MQLVRLLQSQGFGSRAECRALIDSARVAVDDVICTNADEDVAVSTSHFSVDQEPWQYRKHVYIALNKPANHECSHRPSVYPSVYSLLPLPFQRRGIQAVGRLDADTTGLLLLTDDGQFIHTFTSPKKHIGKCYEVTVRHPIAPEQIQALERGVVLHDDPQPVQALNCELKGPNCLWMTVTEGKYHLVKRMIAASGNRVEQLKRISIGAYRLSDELAPGQWQWLGEVDLETLGWTRTR